MHLFSTCTRMHSQSGKLVQKMFDKIQELIDDPDALVCVLIDEVMTYEHLFMQIEPHLQHATC